MGSFVMIEPASANPLNYTINGTVTDEQKEQIRLAINEFGHFCRSLVGPYSKDIKSASVTIGKSCRYCRQLGWKEVIILYVDVVNKVSLTMPANIDVAGKTFTYVIHNDGVLIYKGDGQNLCGLRHSEPTAVLLRNDGSRESVY